MTEMEQINAKRVCNSLQNLYESKKYTDVTIVVGGEEIRAHKGIITGQSSVFAAMFEHDCEENRTNQVVISDVEPDVMDQLLRYIYSGQVSHERHYTPQLLVAADKVCNDIEFFIWVYHSGNIRYSVQECISNLSSSFCSTI